MRSSKRCRGARWAAIQECCTESQLMPRPAIIIVTLSVLVAVGGVTYLRATREKPVAQGTEMPSEAAPRISKHEATPLNADTTVDATPHSSPSSPEAASTHAATPEIIAQWISDTQSADARTRAAAIAALAQAPKAQAVPALEHVLESGEPEVDRQIALRSLHSLAMLDGDHDGSIRDAMRRAMYHGDDEGVTQTAQDLLDDIEAEIATRAESR